MLFLSVIKGISSRRQEAQLSSRLQRTGGQGEHAPPTCESEGYGMVCSPFQSKIVFTDDVEMSSLRIPQTTSHLFCFRHHWSLCAILPAHKPMYVNPVYPTTGVYNPIYGQSNRAYNRGVQSNIWAIQYSLQ